MKKLIFVTLLFSLTFANAQNNLEAKMAYQIAEEKFEAKQYVEALDLLIKAEKALGSVNPPMAYLKVMIANQIAIANENTENGKDALTNLEKAIEKFDKTKGKEALGEAKLLDVYRLKADIAKRAEKVNENNENLLQNKKAVAKAKEILQDLPKLGSSIDVLNQNPYSQFMTTRDVEKIKEKGSRWVYGGLDTMDLGGNALNLIYQENNKISQYRFYKIIKATSTREKSRMMSREDLIEYLNLGDLEKYVSLSTKKPGYFVFSYTNGEVKIYFYIDPEIFVFKGKSGKFLHYIDITTVKTDF